MTKIIRFLIILTIVDYSNCYRTGLSVSSSTYSYTLKCHQHDYFDIMDEGGTQWFDEALIYARGGSGGAGAVTFKFGKGRQHSIPNGGSGGKGGDVILRGDKSLNTLLGFRGSRSYKAENGVDGELEYANGEYGGSVIIPVPLGTLAIDNSTGSIIGEIQHHGATLVIAKGGLGGKGNGAKSIPGEKSRGAPPKGGERKWIRLVLQLVADVGLLGVPNAGKSTILDAITNARPKIASYAFTTIVPNLGVCEVFGPGSVANGGDAIVIADIPGLIEGAHRGAGLGRRFLRHVERCKILIHVVNGDSANPVQEFRAINEELKLFSTVLATKPQIVVLNKLDLPHVAEKKDQIMSELLAQMTHTRILTISGKDRLGLQEFVERTYQFLQKIKADEEKLKNKVAEDVYETVDEGQE